MAWTDRHWPIAEIPTSLAPSLPGSAAATAKTRSASFAPRLGLSRADSVPNLTRRMDARLQARPQLADELQQIMARIEPETKNQV